MANTCSVVLTMVILTLISVTIEGNIKTNVVRNLKRNKLDKVHEIIGMVKKNMDSFKCLCAFIKDSNHINLKGGSTYIRWGSTKCPANGTDLIYTGYAAGALYHKDQGSASNYLCLPKTPEWAKYKDGFQGMGERIYGAEYQSKQHGANVGEALSDSVYEYDVPCSVCESKRINTFMFPGKTTCYDDWHLEYRGYLMAQHKAFSSSEYVCVDASAETIPGTKHNHNGRLFYPVEVACGVLKCPPYVSGREMSCVVCSK